MIFFPHIFKSGVLTNISLKKVFITPLYNMHSLLNPPVIVKGITILDRSLFDKIINVPCLQFKNVQLSSVLSLLKPFLLKIEKLKPIVSDNETRILLNPTVINKWEDIPEKTRNGLETLEVTRTAFLMKDITLKYENYKAEQVLRAVLPEGKEGLSSFTKIGHIVHVNLREHLLPFKNLIGEVLYDKVHNCRTVVNKVDMIDSTYRNFQMELLKGDDDMITTVKENNCEFKFDFSKVYWNSRLCTEHERIVKKLQKDDVLFDVFAGVGPFSVPAAKKKCIVYANDLNPESYNWLEINKKGNKIKDEFLKIYSLDGRDFIKEVFKMEYPKYASKKIYILMNLPAMATEFLDAFVELFDELPENVLPPTIFVYCFAKGEDYVTIAKNLVITNFKCKIDVEKKIDDIFRVRSVSSMKEMMRVTIRLDRDVLLIDKTCSKRKIEDIDENNVKKYKNGEEQKEGDEQRI